MFSFKEYTQAIDVWSVGCILAEILTRKPLFPGETYHKQVKYILDLLGSPTNAERELRSTTYVA